MATANIASGRGAGELGRLVAAGDGAPARRDRSGGVPHLADADALAAALAPLADVAPDVLAVQELDVLGERSGGVHQPRVVAEALAGAGGSVDWRFAPTVLGIPGEADPWQPVAGRLEDERWPEDGRPRYGTALYVRRPVRRWSALALRAGPASVPLPVPGPDGGTTLLVIRDEPRVAVAAETDGLTVVAAHLSFVPPVAVRQLRQVRAWAAGLPGPVLLVGDLNLPGALPARLLGARRLVEGPTYPLPVPTRQLDHVLALRPLGDLRQELLLPWRLGRVDLELAVGDHRALCVDVEVPASAAASAVPGGAPA